MIPETFLKKFLEDALAAVLVFENEKHTCIYANKLALELFDVSTSAGIGLDCLAVEKVQGLNVLPQNFSKQDGTFHDVCLKRANGEVFISHVAIKRDGKMWAVSIVDLTAQKKLEREIHTKEAEIISNASELMKQNQQLRELDKAKDRFFALMSHELRTPISSVVATAQYIHDGLCENETEIKSYVDVILDEAKRILEITNDILDFSKIQAGKLELCVEEKNIFDVIRSRMEHMSKFAMTKNIEIIPQSLPQEGQAYFDDLRISQVFDNILNNAVKFNREGGSIFVKGEALPDRPFIRISISDTGDGIPANLQGKVFDEFETIENLHNHHKGTGLGMPICKRLMDLMGGSISFESKTGEGTTFFVDIPTIKVLESSLYKSRNPKIVAA